MLGLDQIKKNNSRIIIQFGIGNCYLYGMLKNAIIFYKQDDSSQEQEGIILNSQLLSILQILIIQLQVDMQLKYLTQIVNCLASLDSRANLFEQIIHPLIISLKDYVLSKIKLQTIQMIDFSNQNYQQ
ncbi:unnamed protein product (macronuclear) [Paramecium tetraurelia]|uniref:Uncharacterized protein n=1 Tax=Paramecium tetraurelia TaxID=5888 RepID=A0BVV7_PARTE|nr:uncharacterized protein GSPATT00032526001 [Paramecium tetraurelia]CAK62674.1 unnamed protein product [Paramecium tetraurelia]|eukprot:XP_001430072.1 hypothetical protein (macronuclear) [Paramecium tetraurelia strain d4-2]